MKVSNFEYWLKKHYEWLSQQPHQWPSKALSEAKTEERRVIHSQFPHIVTVEGHYEFIDLAEAWCWDQFGPANGLCLNQYSSYKRCPEVTNLEFQCKNHSHEGIWAFLWLQKTGYDYGFCDFCFSTYQQELGFINRVNEIERNIK